jgi:homoserine dehydrogenase
VLHAILNGTCNVVLARMEQGAPFQQALAEAQRDGYAEADPSLDVDGIDAAHKLALLARLAVDPELEWAGVRGATRGIRGVTPAHLAAAAEAGARVRLVGTLEADAGSWRARVRPVRLPLGHPLLSARHVQNALWLRSAPLGEVLIVGPGAGGGATASAVLADVLQAAAGRPGPAPLATAVPLPDDGAQEDELGGLEPVPGLEAA